MQLKTRSLAALGLAALALLALFVAACSSDVSESDLDKANARVDELQTQATKAQILAAITSVRADDLHGLDEALAEADAIDESWISRATRVRRAVASVTWPDDMKDRAAELVTTLTALEDALTHGNLDDARAAAPDAHDQYHELEHDASPYIAGETPAPEADHGGEATGTAQASEAAH